MNRLIQLFSILMLATLAGCGGPTGTGDNEQIITSEPGINLSMSVASTGESATEIPANDDAIVDILFLDETGSPVVNEIVSLSTSAGTLSNNSILTDASGRGEVTIFAPALTNASETGTLTATSTAWTGDAGVLHYEFYTSNNVEEDPDAPDPASIGFISASPEYMSLKGTGGVGYGETSQVTFKVVDLEGIALEGVVVSFNLSTTVGGLALYPDAAKTNASGEVSTTVQAGTISTPVRVGASITLDDGSLIYVQSDLLTVTTGIPDQNSISLSMDKFAPEGLNHDGERVIVTVRLADRFNNPVPDGTVINFTTEGGSIESTCSTLENECSVVWESQAPRPLDHRSTVLAYAIGHETYYDPNGSGVFDDGDSFDDLGEAFRDDDESGTYNPLNNDFSKDEKLIDYDESFAYSPADGVYNGVPCEHSLDCPIDANNIAGRSNFLTNVRDQGVIIMANSAPNLHLYEILSGSSCLDSNGKLNIDGVQCANVTNFGAGIEVKSFWVMVEDTAALCVDGSGNRIDGVVNPNAAACTVATRQSAPTGAAITVSSEVGTLSPIPYSSVPNSTGHLEFVFTLTSDGENAEVSAGALEVKVSTSVGGVDVYQTRSITDPIN